jgi:hypothetical protein
LLNGSAGRGNASIRRLLSLQETAEPVLAKIEYPEKERKVQFQTGCNRASAILILQGVQVTP